MAFGKKIRQVNNMTIRYTVAFQYAVWSPYGICLEDGLTMEQAVSWAKEQKDFLAKRKGDHEG